MNKKNYLTILIALIILASAYCAYAYLTNDDSTVPASDLVIAPNNITPTKAPAPAPIEEPTSITVVDGIGNTVTIPLPVTRIAALDGSIVETLCVMGVQNLIVARCETTVMPPSILNVPSVGQTDSVPNVEAIIALEPDVIFASTMLSVGNSAAYTQFENAGIPVYIVNMSIPEPSGPSKMTKDELYNSQTSIDFICGLMQKLTPIVGHQEQVTAYIDWVQPYNQLLKDRIYALPSDQQVTVFLEWYSIPYRTIVTMGIPQAGGINIAENQDIYMPTLAPEFVVEQNPSVIIEMFSNPAHDINDFINAKNNVLSRDIFNDVDAIKNERVYILEWSARNGVRSVVGYLYMAKWIHPDLFLDIDPAAVNQELNQKFYGDNINGTFGYP
ncbi:MAG: ABC transporter substrate-binding protein [Candidatus Bathyarchaeota archaeon]|nr:ABC transporter substrate-binding protein [Candidatus Termiticorpusculum sp.]